MSEQANILSFDEAKSRGASRRRAVHAQGQHASSRSSLYSRKSATGERLSNQASLNRSGRISVQQNGYHRSNQQARQIPRSMHANASSQRRSSTSVSPRRSARVSQEGSQRFASSRNSRSSREASSEPTFIQGLKKRARSAKAEREFNKTISSKESRNEEPTSRAALYEMRMGRTQKRSTKMQNDSSSGNSKRAKSVSLSSLFSWMSSAIASRFVIAGCCVFFTFVMLYQPLADYYDESRQLQQLEAEYSALEEQNASLKSEIDYLNTDAGLEDYARYKLGYIRADEQTATVENIEPSSKVNDTSGSISYSIPAGSVPAPDTWYSGVLDFIFGYGK